MENDKFKRVDTQDNYVTEKVDIIKNNLLGSYDDNGNYVIAQQIISELIQLKKIRKKSFENSMYCVGNLLGYGEILFEIKYDKPDDQTGLAKIELFVLEEVDKVNGYLHNTIRTKISELESDVNNFMENSYVSFNVSNDEDGGQDKKSLDNMVLDDSYILAKKSFTLLLEKLSDEKVLDAYGKYFTARLSMLSKLDNDFSRDVLDSFNSRYNLIEKYFLKDKNYKALNELLDASIEEISGTKDLYVWQQQEFNDKMSDALMAFTDNVNKLSDKAQMKAMNMLDKSDRAKVTEMNESLDGQALDTSSSNGDNDDGVKEIDEIPASLLTESYEENVQKQPEIENPVLLDEEEKEAESEEESEQETEQTEPESQEPSIVDQIADAQKLAEEEKAEKEESEIVSIVDEIQNMQSQQETVEPEKEETTSEPVKTEPEETQNIEQSSSKTMEDIFKYFTSRTANKSADVDYNAVKDSLTDKTNENLDKLKGLQGLVPGRNMDNDISMDR